MRSRLARLAALLLLVAGLLCGCLAPERYMARVRIERDGSYKFYVEGTAIQPDAYRALKRLGPEVKGDKTKAEEQAKGKAEALKPLLEELEPLKGDTRIQAMNSIGDGRVRFSIGGVWRFNRDLLILNELREPLAYSVEPDGVLRVRLKDALPNRETRAVGRVTEGSVTISLAEGIEVLAHNAQRTPTTPSGSYRWSITDATTEAPYLRIRLPGSVSRDEAAPGEHSTAPQQKELAHH